jgi:apolipoprotein N-acyltransferase
VSNSASRPSRGRLALFARTSLPALLGGLGLALSIPPWGFWVLAFPSTALLWWVLGHGVAERADRTGAAGRVGGPRRLGRPRFRTRLWIGWVAGIGLFGPGLFWATSFNVYGGIILIIVESLALGLACGACGSGRGRIIALPGAMVLAEWIRDIWPFGGLPLGGVDLGQVSGPLGGAARLGGPLLLTGLVWLGGAGIGSLLSGMFRAAAVPIYTRRFPAGWRKLVDHHEVEQTPADLAPVVRKKRTQLVLQPKLGPALGGAAAIGLVVALAAVGAVAPNGGPALRIIKVASVQGGGVRGLRKADVNTTVVQDAQVDATAQLDGMSGFGNTANTKKSERALVVWPEDVVSIPFPGNLAGTKIEGSLSEIARRLHATLLVGVTETVSSTAFRNEIVAFSPSGSVVGTYEKVHRVPFGEYVPFRGFFSHLANLSSVPQDAIPGHSKGFLTTPTAPVGLMVSYEVFFAQAGRSATRAGAQILVVPTNTSSYSTSQVPTQEVAADRLQAIEEGRDLVQTAPTGFSTIVDNEGRVLQRSVLGARQVLVASLALRDGATVYERFGDLPVLLLAAICLLLGWMLDLTEPTLSDRTPGAAAARANWKRLRSGEPPSGDREQRREEHEVPDDDERAG